MAPHPDAPLHKNSIRYAVLLKRLHDICLVSVLNSKKKRLQNLQGASGGSNGCYDADEKISNYSKSQGHRQYPSASKRSEKIQNRITTLILEGPQKVTNIHLA